MPVSVLHFGTDAGSVRPFARQRSTSAGCGDAAAAVRPFAAPYCITVTVGVNQHNILLPHGDHEHMSVGWLLSETMRLNEEKFQEHLHITSLQHEGDVLDLMDMVSDVIENGAHIEAIVVEDPSHPLRRAHLQADAPAISAHAADHIESTEGAASDSAMPSWESARAILNGSAAAAISGSPAGGSTARALSTGRNGAPSVQWKKLGVPCTHVRSGPGAVRFATLYLDVRELRIIDGKPAKEAYFELRHNSSDANHFHTGAVTGPCGARLVFQVLL
jgi:hypothetical protein